jgi:hypothetical protein
MPLVKAGKYIAKLSGPVEGSKSGIIIYETQRSALCAAFLCKISEGPETGKALKATQTLVRQDGTVQRRTISGLKAIFGWDGEDPFWLMDNQVSDIPFEIDVVNEPGVDQNGFTKKDAQGNTVQFSKVKWINPLGSSMKLPYAADRRSVLAKHGTKFRALAGGAQSEAPATKPQLAGPTATIEEAGGSDNVPF